MSSRVEPPRLEPASDAGRKSLIFRKFLRRRRGACSLKAEIALAFGLVIALIIALGTTFYLSEKRSMAAIDKLLKSDGRMADLSLRSSLAMARTRCAESNFLRSADRLGMIEARERYLRPMQNHLLDMREYLTSVRILSSDPALTEKISRIERHAQRYEAGFLAFVEALEKTGQTATAPKLQQDYHADLLAIEPLLEEVYTAASKRALETQRAVESAAGATQRTVLATVAIAVLFGAMVAAILSRRISGSVAQLIDFSRRVAAGNFGARTQHSKEREFAILARAMNRMAASLQQSQTQMLATARKAGMAEVATNVLHNVGNILNSVNVSAGLLGHQLHASRVAGLSRAVHMMEEHAADLGSFLGHDDKGKLLPGYLARLAQALAAERQAMIEELAHLTRSIDHIKQVVATQQSHAGHASFVEPVRISDLVEDALRMNGDALKRQRVTVVKKLAQVPVSRLDKTRVMQILVNLIRNAAHAMEAAAGRAHILTLQVDVVAKDRLRICVTDDGEGIAAENMTRIFTHGFTTRTDGRGFGLHSCALAAAEIGGTLTVQSEGPGEGAAFTLELPLEKSGPAP